MFGLRLRCRCVVSRQLVNSWISGMATDTEEQVMNMLSLNVIISKMWAR